MLERANIRDFWFHDLRNTFASWYMTNGGDLYELAKLMGHTNIKMTERYAKLGRAHITKTGSTAKVIWTMMDKNKPQQKEPATRRTSLDVRVLFARPNFSSLPTSKLLKRWWPETGSNRRRRPFQGRALPLSYLAMGKPVGCAEASRAAGWLQRSPRTQEHSRDSISIPNRTPDANSASERTWRLS